MRASFDVSATSPAQPPALWALLLDAHSWPRWGTVDALVPERSEDISPDGRDGVGAVRAFRTGRVVTGERITELVGDRTFRYEDAFNPVMKDYRAEISLSEVAGGGTAIRWRGTYRVSAAMFLVLPSFLRRTMQRMADGLAAAGGVRAA